MDVNKILGIVNLVTSLFQMFSKFNGVKAKENALQMKMRLVSARKADINLELEQEERRPGKRRRTEVGLWIECVGLLEGQVRDLERKFEEGNLFDHIMLEDQVIGLATELEKLHAKSRFLNGLTLDEEPARGYKLQPGELVGQASQTIRDEIWDCLMKEEVLRVGVWGQRGVGKTFLAKHIHDRIVQDCARFDGACLVTVSQEGTVGRIQTDIANYLKLDLTEVSGVYRGARLKEALQGRRLVFILDDVGKYYSLEEVGIALGRNGCKLILTSRSRDVCEQMNCHDLVHVPTLAKEAPQGLEEVSKLEPEGLGKLEEGSSESQA